MNGLHYNCGLYLIFDNDKDRIDFDSIVNVKLEFVKPDGSVITPSFAIVEEWEEIKNATK